MKITLTITLPDVGEGQANDYAADMAERAELALDEAWVGASVDVELLW